MKNILLALTGLATIVAAGRPAQADFIIGQQSFSTTAVVSPTGNVANTSFTFSFVTDISPSQQTGDYAPSFGAFINGLNTMTPGAFSFGNAGVYGSFLILSVNENSVGSVSRTVNFTGIFFPSAVTFPGYDPTPGSLTITVNQPKAGVGPFVLSASATLITALIPEPSSIVLLGTFCVSAAGVWLRRRKQSASP